MLQQQIILASASPRRQELLQQIGVDFRVISQDIDESLRQDEPAADYVLRMANAKADSALTSLAQDDQSVVLAADTIVVCDGEVMGKPADRDSAVGMLLKLSAREHHVFSAITVATQQQRFSAMSDSVVCFRAITLDEAEDYWRSTEPIGKAGAYAIQGRAAIFVKQLSGSYSSVMGLPLYETAELLSRFDIKVLNQ